MRLSKLVISRGVSFQLAMLLGPQAGSLRHKVQEGSQR